MRFNEKELKQLALQLKCFRKEGHLFFRECQESFFRKSIEINNLRWVKLYNNLLFILKTNDQFSEPAGVIILENVHQICSSTSQENNFAFVIEFKDGNKQYFEARSESEKNEWITTLRTSICEKMRERLDMLRIILETRRGSMKNDIAIETSRNIVLGETYEKSWEVSISCDNLICNIAGKAPNPAVVIQIKDKAMQRWINYGKTEMIEGCSNAEFFSTILFRKSDGVDENSIIRVNLFDIREKFSQVSVPIGSVDCEMMTIIESKQKRLLLKAYNNDSQQDMGFVTLSIQTKFKKSNDFFNNDAKCENSHFSNPILSTYHFVSGLGKEISVFDWMFESRLSFIIPQQLLSIWISREKELIQEISGIGELDTEWKQKQIKLLDIHLRLLKNYSHAKKAIQHFMCLDRRSFKPSTRKSEQALEFIPVNLHLQRTNITCDRLNLSQEYSMNNIYDVITVGAFTSHNKNKNGGLLKLLHLLKDSPSTADQVQHKIQVANENVQSIKQLRREVVNIMCKIISMARCKTIEKNMLPLCQMIIEKTRSLVTILEPSLVETTFKFIEEHRVTSECEKTELFFERIIQKISDLTSPEINTHIEEILINSVSQDCEEEKDREEFYRPSEEPPPIELIQLNLEASVMCLVAKIKLHCGRVGSPAVRIRQPLNSANKYRSSTTHDDDYFSKEKDELSTKFETLINTKSTDEWVEELRPAMKKLSSAMDGLLKTARLVHSVHRLQQNMKKMSSNMSIIYHRDVCFSQALTSLISALTAKFWNNKVDSLFIDTLCRVGPLAYFEGFLSLYGAEFDFWSDMNVAIEDLSAVNFSLVYNKNEAEPKVSGSRQALFVSIPVPEEVHNMLPLNFENFKVTVVFFNIGINEKATLAETLGYCKDQTRSNNDNFEKLNIYFTQYKKMKSNDRNFVKRIDAVQELLLKLEQQLKLNTPKNIEILELAEDITRLLSNGFRFTSCKSAKDRTSMAVTLEQTRLLLKNYQLPESNFERFLATLRYGTRLENTFKNVGKHMYAFNLTQIYSLPKPFRPPPSTYGKIQT